MANTKAKNEVSAEELEQYTVVYNQYIYFQENCGVQKVVIKQSGKPKGGDKPPGT